MKIGHLLHLEVVVVNKESHEAASQRQDHRSGAKPLFPAARVVVAVVQRLKDVAVVEKALHVVVVDLEEIEVEKAGHVVDLVEVDLVEVAQQVVVEQVA